MPNQCIVCFFARSDWLLKLGIASAIFLDFVRELSLISQKKEELFGAGYPLVWHILKQLFTSIN